MMKTTMMYGRKEKKIMRIMMMAELLLQELTLASME